MWSGANFKLKIRKVEGYQNYDKSEFESPSILGDFDDDKLEAIWKSEHSLKEFLSPDNFKPYDELKAKLDKVLGTDGTVAPKTTVESAKAPAAARKPSPVTSDTSDDDGDLAYFSKLAEEE